MHPHERHTDENTGQKRHLPPNVNFPMPTAVVATLVEHRPDFATVIWLSRVAAEPPLIAVSLHRRHATVRGIQETGAFSVNLPGTDLLERVDAAGLVSADAGDKSVLFTVRHGELDGLIYADECPLNLGCSFVERVACGSNDLVIGEIREVLAEPGVTDGDHVDPVRAGYLFCSLPDLRYFGLGGELGPAWRSGRSLSEQIRRSRGGHRR
jgi:flavin reductase (DIM6/NTAB) family NADH-FMN oxidoreductase RutF